MGPLARGSTSSHCAYFSAHASMLFRSARLGVSTAGSVSACPEAGHMALPLFSHRWMYLLSYLQGQPSVAENTPATLVDLHAPCVLQRSVYDHHSYCILFICAGLARLPSR